jgi:ketosteroid isomerase-like protein
MKLKYLTYFLLGIALFSIFWPGKMDLGLAAPAEDSAHDQIVAILTEQQAAWNRGDLHSFMKSYWNSPELTFAGSSGITRGWQPVLARYQRNYPDRQAMGHLDFSELEVHALGKDAAFVLGRWHLQRSSDELGGIFTLVFQRFPEGWRIVHDHTSQDAKKP